MSIETKETSAYACNKCGKKLSRDDKVVSNLICRECDKSVATPEQTNNKLTTSNQP